MNDKTSYACGIAAPIILLLWGGLALGGNMIVAPAKFQVEQLPLEDLLRIGRAQFAWLGVAEIVFAAGFIGLCLFKRTLLSWLSVVALLVLLIQQIGLQPLLQARTDLILTAQPVPSSNLHLVFIASEVCKFAFLVLAAIDLLRLQQSRTIGTMH
jgi:hypothetical protein